MSKLWLHEGKNIYQSKKMFLQTVNLFGFCTRVLKLTIQRLQHRPTICADSELLTITLPLNVVCRCI